MSPFNLGDIINVHKLTNIYYPITLMLYNKEMDQNMDQVINVLLIYRLQHHLDETIHYYLSLWDHSLIDVVEIFQLNQHIVTSFQYLFPMVFMENYGCNSNVIQVLFRSYRIHLFHPMF